MEDKDTSSNKSVDSDSNSRQKNSNRQQCSCLRKVSDVVIGGLETAFYKIGWGIATYPWLVMLCCVVFTAAFCAGLTDRFFEQVTAPDRLWVPIGSQSLEEKVFVDENFPTSYRFQQMTLTAENILTPECINTMLDIDLEVKNTLSEPGKLSWENLCARLGQECWSNSLLELWSFDESTIRALTQLQILNKINSVTTSPVYGNEYNVSQVLGGITWDPVSGDITAAEATIMQWVLQPNGTDSVINDEVDEDILNWEEQFIVIGSKERPSLTEVYYYAARSFGDEGGGAIGGDVLYLSIGYILVIIFIAIVLGKFTRIKHRIYVSFSGVISIGLAIIVSFGLCSYAGLFFGPVHSVLPFLLLGIGVDDMFVICQALDRLSADKDALETRERIGYALKHAGVSITVTSLTDILAFAVGSSTVLPALRSFCAYAAVGILATFIFQITFFVACLAYDDLRVAQERNACCCCIIHKDDVPRECSNTLVVQTVFEKFYAPLMVKLATKIVVTVIAAALLAVCIWGTVNLEQDFDFAWFLPKGSYARNFIEINDFYFPSSGTPSAVYFGEINYYQDYQRLENIYFDVRRDEYVSAATVDSWYYSYRGWLNVTSDPACLPLLDPDRYPTSESNFITCLQIYLYSPSSEGSRFISNINFDHSTGVSKILASRFNFQHIRLDNAAHEIEAMDSVRSLIASYGYDPVVNFVYSPAYLNFESNKAIKNELFRNLGFAFLCIFIMTLILLADIVGCLIVCLCVIISLVDVGGCMQFWGLTIDTVTSINLIVAIGLTVDYSAHVAHTFLTNTGSRNERVEATLKQIGPPVFFGGFSTFLAFIMLAGSNSYVFYTFFQVFLLVVIIGLFHGLMVLPVLLSWMGPPAYTTADNTYHKKSQEPNIVDSKCSVRNPQEPSKESHLNQKENGLFKQVEYDVPNYSYENTAYVVEVRNNKENEPFAAEKQDTQSSSPASLMRTTIHIPPYPKPTLNSDHNQLITPL